jgi:hypothetical protein
MVNRVELSGDLAAACFRHLEEEEAALNRVLELLRENRRAMLDRSTDKLLETARHLQSHHASAAIIQNRRRRLRKQMANHLGIPVEHATISQCLQFCDSELRGRMRDLQQRLQDIAKSLDTLVHGNVILATQFSQLIDHTLRLLSGDSATPRYGSSGQLDRSQEMSVFETRL